MEQGKQVCLPAMIPSVKRKTKMYFSQPSVAHSNNRIVMLNQDNDYFDIVQSLGDKTKILGIDQGRSYGKAIDEIKPTDADQKAMTTWWGKEAQDPEFIKFTKKILSIRRHKKILRASNYFLHLHLRKH